MGRRAEGWKIRPRGDGAFQLRFTHQGRRVELALRASDLDEAARLAPGVYAAWITGRYQERVTVRAADPRAPSDEILALWIASVENTRSKGTRRTWEVYARHFLGVLPSVADLNPAGVARYTAARLGAALRGTVSKELSALRHFLAWAHAEGYVGELVPVPPVERAAAGTRTGTRKERHQALDVATVERILDALPAWSRAEGERRYAVAAFFRLAWETGLRPGTLARLEAPRHYRAGATHLTITADVDKNKYGRRVALTAAARAALDAIVPEEGRILGVHDRRRYLREAGEAAGLTGPALDELCAYDLRHSRITHLLEESGNLPGVAFLVGHRRVTTTNRYTHGTERAGAAVLESVERPDRSGSNSGSWVRRRRSKRRTPLGRSGVRRVSDVDLRRIELPTSRVRFIEDAQERPDLHGRSAPETAENVGENPRSGSVTQNPGPAKCTPADPPMRQTKRGAS